MNGRWSGGQLCIPRLILLFVLLLLCFLSLLFRLDTAPRRRGVHRLGQLDSRRRFQSSCSQIACNFIFVFKYVFLVRYVASRRKTGTQTALTSNYTTACLGGRLGWALVCWQGRGFNTPEEKMAIGRTVVRKPRAQPWLLFYSNSLCWLNIAGVVGGDCLGKGKQISPQQDASIGSSTKLHIKLYFKRFCQYYILVRNAQQPCGNR